MKENKITFRQIEQPEIRLEESEGARRMTFVASNGTRDAAGTVLNVDGWDLRRFNKNGIIGYQHDVYYSNDPDAVIGKGRAYVKDGQLLVDVEFEPADMNELADKVWKKLQFGTLKAVSVGFRPVGGGEWGKGEEAPGGATPTYYYKGQELLEVSVVNIPSNPDALKKSFVQEAMEAEQAALREDAGEPAPAAEPQAEPAPAAEPGPEDRGAEGNGKREEGEARLDEAAEAERLRLSILARAASL